ncbi:phage head morphogenesis protein, partial [Pseudoalteromonas sp. NBT06-2]|uniref:phage head morphogenesis protein n=1 Tax=Pseudoalteromonas sp. NBT06-2 TaxID=2025950 RepID=UPI000BA5E8F8
SEFRKRFDNIVKDHGWSYKGRRGWRTQVIYQNNKNTARAAGRWQQQERLKDRRPFLMYLTAGDNRVRAEHHKWHKIVLPVEHEFWYSHYPPNGWNCRCKVVSINYRDIERMKLKITDQDTLIDAVTVNEKTGGLAGIDLGWDYNPGKAWLGSDISLGKSLLQMDEILRAHAIPQFNKAILKSEPHYKSTVSRIAAQIALETFKDDKKIMMLAHLNNETISKLVNESRPITSSMITISTLQISEALSSGIQIESIFELMNGLHKMDKFTYDGRTLNLILNGTMIAIELSAPFNKVIKIHKQ